MSGPERIYLQDAGDYDAAADFEVTWCVEPQDDKDTEYIRADLADPTAIREAALREAAEALWSAQLFGRTPQEQHAALEQYCLCRDAILALIDKPAPDHSATPGNMIDKEGAEA